MIAFLAHREGVIRQMSNDQIYDTAEEIADRLEAEGFQANATAIRDAMYGATSGEILGALGHELHQTLKNQPGISHELRSLSRQLFTEIEDVLLQAGTLPISMKWCPCSVLRAVRGLVKWAERR